MRYLLLLLLLTGCVAKAPVDPCLVSKNTVIAHFNEENWLATIYIGELFMKKCPGHYGEAEINFVLGYAYDKKDYKLEAVNRMMMSTKQGLEYKLLWRAHDVWARNLLKLDRSEEALQVVEKAFMVTSVADQIASLYRLQGNIYLNMKDPDKAIASFEMSQPYDVGNAWTWTGMGTAYSYKKDWPKAKHYYELALVEDPNNKTAKESLEWVEGQK